MFFLFERGSSNAESFYIAIDTITLIDLYCEPISTITTATTITTTSPPPTTTRVTVITATAITTTYKPETNTIVTSITSSTVGKNSSVMLTTTNLSNMNKSTSSAIDAINSTLLTTRITTKRPILSINTTINIMTINSTTINRINSTIISSTLSSSSKDRLCFTSDRLARETNDNVITVIESLKKHFIDENDDCPRFFMDCLKKACEHAFSSTKIEERRPVLVNIQNRKSTINTIFDSFNIIDYLNENYIVWTWDINLESNRILLNNMWRDVFSCEFPYSRNVKEYPILIGIMRFYQEKKIDLFISAYQFKKLLQGEILRTENIYIEKILIDKLALFKAESDENKRSLSFDFICKSGLCWNVIFEILEYLTLNDAISLFSANILPILRKYNRKI
ncbi:unnamed protein product [Rotaria sp. Silwood1]|nr:unnamed protein product [Rotaria sp. Silwood1]